jgi:hypothetical protein
MGGQEIILAIDARIERRRANIQYKRDEIDGKIERPTGHAYSVPAEAVEEEIRQLDYRLPTLIFIREIDLSRGIHWVTRPIEVD